MSLENRVVLITGGTGGLGKGVTTAFLKSGARVVVTYRSDSELGELRKGLGKEGGRLQALKVDLSEEKEVTSLFQQISSEHRRLDVLVHLVGGFWMGGDLAETPLQKWRQMLDINLNIAFLCLREAFSRMKKQGSGKIFTVSARAALDLPAGMGAYAVSKAALLALTRVLAAEGAKHQVQVNAVLPGTIDTPANRQAMPDADFDQWVKPGEIAETILALATAENAPLSGTALKVYGKA